MTGILRVCNSCLQAKIDDEFYTTRPGYKNPRCKECCRKYVRDSYPAQREKHLAYQKHLRETSNVYRERNKKALDKLYQSIRGRAQSLYRTAKKSKTGQTRPFTLTIKHVTEGLVRGTCAVTQIPFVFTRNGVTQNHPFAPSLDKIDPHGPYSNENTRVVIWQYNTFKGQISDADVYLIAHAVITGLEKQWR
jgi:hypothetical protein